MSILAKLFGTRIEGPSARRLVAEGALLLDVRTTGEFAAGHVPGAVNIPVQDLPDRIAGLVEGTRPIVVYCRSGMRSAQAAGMLRRAGHPAVHDLGGMSNW
jgi:rhodanese-related sulfurtransferase